MSSFSLFVKGSTCNLDFDWLENDLERLFDIEQEVNELVRGHALKVYHGLVLRNAIEEGERTHG